MVRPKGELTFGIGNARRIDCDHNYYQCDKCLAIFCDGEGKGRCEMWQEFSFAQSDYDILPKKTCRFCLLTTKVENKK